MRCFVPCACVVRASAPCVSDIEHCNACVGYVVTKKSGFGNGGVRHYNVQSQSRYAASTLHSLRSAAVCMGCLTRLLVLHHKLIPPCWCLHTSHRKPSIQPYMGLDAGYSTI